MKMWILLKSVMLSEEKPDTEKLHMVQFYFHKILERATQQEVDEWATWGRGPCWDCLQKGRGTSTWRGSLLKSIRLKMST